MTIDTTPKLQVMTIEERDRFGGYGVECVECTTHTEYAVVDQREGYPRLVPLCSEGCREEYLNPSEVFTPLSVRPPGVPLGSNPAIVDLDRELAALTAIRVELDCLDPISQRRVLDCLVSHYECTK